MPELLITDNHLKLQYLFTFPPTPAAFCMIPSQKCNHNNRL